MTYQRNIAQELVNFAEEGRKLTKDLYCLSTNYKHAAERKKKQNKGGKQ